MREILLINPPFTQLNTPYPATAYLKGFLNTKNITSFQIDLGLEVILQLFSKQGLHALFKEAEVRQTIHSNNAIRIFHLRDRYIQTIDQVIAFLQGQSPTLARSIASERWLPEASRFDQLDELEWAFGAMGIQDKAKHLATLYLEEISDFIVECVDDLFGFSRYAERIGRSANQFAVLEQHLSQSPSYIDQITIAILNKKIQEVEPALICFSVPFPGNLYSAFRCAQDIKKHFPTIKIAMGGGFPNTELRSLQEVKVFDYFDYISLDDGWLPLELIFQDVKNPVAAEQRMLKRTFVREAGKVVYNNHSLRQDYKHADTGIPEYTDLPLDRYISVIEVANPMHSLWSDGRWNKLTMAFGCYWGKCTFCDVSLDYIKNYEPIVASQIVDRMEALIEQTNERGFHFVDEAAPPALMKEVALEIIRRNLIVTWWTNIRFEKSFTRDLCHLLATSGCIAVSGGLEVASDRLLDLIKKGVTVQQVAQVTSHFTESGIMVHAYLMYGYPTQTVQETIDSLEMVRQLFECGVIQSGFWHQFALTAHSPIGMDSASYGLTTQDVIIDFAHNDIVFEDLTGIDHNQFSYGLKKSLFNFMHGLCLDNPLSSWFDFTIPDATIPPDYIERCIDDVKQKDLKPNDKMCFLGNMPFMEAITNRSKGKNVTLTKFHFYFQTGEYAITLKSKEAIILETLLSMIIFPHSPLKSVSEINTQLITQHSISIEEILSWPVMAALRDQGVLLMV